MSEIYFDHEKLKVYQRAIEFSGWVADILREIQIKNSIIDQLDRASSSIALNIAESNGKYTGRDRCRYLDIARGSALECSSCLDIMLVKRMIEKSVQVQGKNILKEIVSMLVGLIKANSDRAYENQTEYNSTS